MGLISLNKISGNYSDVYGNILSFFPTWKKKDIVLTRIPMGLSSYNFKLDHLPTQKSYLYKQYKKKKLKDMEVKMLRFFNKFNFGAKVLFSSPIGRIEEWIDGKKVVINSVNWILIARELARFHRECRLNHNDLHAENILQTKNKKLHFIDFEFNGKLDPSYDIANFFCEMMFDYDSKKPHKADLKRFPKLDQIKLFCGHYLKTGNKNKIMACAKKVISRVPESHHFWIKWAESSNTDFNRKYIKTRKEMLEINFDKLVFM